MEEGHTQCSGGSVEEGRTQCSGGSVEEGHTQCSGALVEEGHTQCSGASVEECQFHNHSAKNLKNIELGPSSQFDPQQCRINLT